MFWDEKLVITLKKLVILGHLVAITRNNEIIFIFLSKKLNLFSLMEQIIRTNNTLFALTSFLFTMTCLVTNLSLSKQHCV